MFLTPDGSNKRDFSRSIRLSDQNCLVRSPSGEKFMLNIYRGSVRSIVSPMKVFLGDNFAISGPFLLKLGA